MQSHLAYASLGTCPMRKVNKANHAMAVMIVCCMQLHSEANLVKGAVKLVCCMQLHNEANSAKGAVKPLSVAGNAKMLCQRKHNSDLIDTLVSRIPMDLKLLRCNLLKS